MSKVESSQQSSNILCYATALIRDWQFLAADESFHEILGYPPEKLIGQSVDTLYEAPAHGLASFRDTAQQHLRAGRPVSLTTSWCRADGTVADVVVILQAQDPDLQTLALQAVDVSDHFRSAKLAVKHQQTLDVILEHSPLGFGLLVLDPSGNRVMGWHNTAMARIFGYTGDTLVGKSSRVLYPDDDIFRRSGLTIRDEIARQGFCDFNPVMMRQDGAPLSVRVIVVPVQMDNEIPLLTIVEDVTEQVQAETSLQQSDARLEAVLRAAPMGIGITRERRLIWSNSAIYNIVGYKAEELLGRSVRMLYPSAEAFVEAGQRLFSAMAENGVGELETVLVSKANTPVNVMIRQAWMDRTDPDSDAVVTMTDLTAVKRAEADNHDLQQQVHELQKMEAIGQLAGGVAHDFNNLLMGISGYAELMSQTSADFTSREQAESTLEIVSTAAELTQQLMDFSRPADKEHELFDTHEIVSEVVQMLRQIVDRNIRIETVLDAPRPGLLGVRSQIKSAVVNLCLNARDAMPKGGRLMLRTRNQPFCAQADAGGTTAPPSEHLVLEVEDTGHGMTDEVRKRIFEPFYTTKAPGTGTGLGLSVVYGSIRRLAGDIQVRSRPEQGTTFELFLPRPASAVTPKPAEPEVENLPQDRTGCLLLVDDEPFVLSSVERLLTQVGYEVLTARSGEEALDVFKAHADRIELVLLDLVMPGIGGSEALRRLRELEPLVKVLVTSGISGGELQQNLLSMGAAGVLAKPYRLSHLLAQITATLSAD